MNILRQAIAGSVLAYSAAASAQPINAAPEAAADTDIVVTAQRRAENVRDVPISLTVVSPETLRTAGVVDVVGLERVTPGLSMQQQNGYVNPSLRGISTSAITAGSENPIAVYLDGVYVSNMGASTFSLPDVERIEVLKGPQGTLFGRNATGGAIQIATKRPSMTPTGQLEATAGYYTGAGSSRPAYDFVVKGFVSGPIAKDVVAASVAFSVRRSNGFGTNVVYGAVSPAVDRVLGSNRVARYRDFLIRSKLLLEPTDALSILLTGYVSDTKSDRNQGGYIGLNGTALTDTILNNFPDRVTGTKPWQAAFDALEPGTRVKTRGGSAKIDWELDGAGTLTSTSAYSWSKYFENNDADASYIPGCLAAFACNAVFDSIRDRNFQQEILFASEKFGRFSFVSGLNYYRANARVDVQVSDFVFGSHPLGNATNPPVFFYDQTVKTKAIGAFAEATIDITDSLTAIAGIRYSDEKKTGVLSTFGGLDFTTFQTVLFLPPNFPLTVTKAKKWTPRFSLRYAIDDRTNAYFTFSQGFKSGLIPGGAPGAPEVKPEKITAYEVGVKMGRPQFTLNAAAFYYNYSDLQVQTNAGTGGVVNLVLNAAKARIWGFDVDGTAHLSDSLSIRGGFSWIPYAKYLDYKGAPILLPRPIDPSDPTRTNIQPDANGNYPPGVFVPGTNIDLSGTRLFKTPKLTLTASATYVADVGPGEVSITPNVYYASKLYTDPTHLEVLSTDNFKLGAEIAYKPREEGWRIALWGRNLTNDSSFVSLSNNGTGIVVIPGDPMEVGATLTFGF